MKSLSTSILSILAFALALFSVALAHPEDEFCSADSGMDPALCRELADLDSKDKDATAPDYGGTKIEVSVDRPIMETVSLYVKLGFVHILPAGYDHILFVLALFLGATNRRQLLIQISTFTIAHTLTLGLATLGIVNAPASIVEPLIALSIAYAAIENILFPSMTKWRPLIVFGFGLFHGLGFAGLLKSLGLVQGQFITSLISFNAGVELGQITIIIMAAILLTIILRLQTALDGVGNYRRRIEIIGSAIIAAFGLFWFANRVMGLL